ncbi:MAG: chloride channel protein, partial [Nitrososphaerota archaeon]|nr:chloride channel protein [Nitrososphaerota archaeon]
MSASKDKTNLEREESRIGLLTLLAVGIGLAGGLIAFALYHLIGLVTNLFYYGRFDFSFASPQFNHLGALAIVLPVVGGLVAGLMIKYGSVRIIGHGIPETMESILLNRSKIEPKVGVLKAMSAAVTIGSGQPFGAEGPIIQTGGAFGSFVGQRISMTGAERKILLASGAAAGMAATFGTPIAAILLAIELLLFEFRVKSLVPVAVAAAIGGWMHIYLISPQPLFQTPAFDFGGIPSLPFYVGLGLICGVLGSALSRGLYKTEGVFSKLKLGQPWLPAVGGLAVGVIGFAVPQVLGVGYDVIGGVLNGQFAVGVVLMILVAKAVAWLLAMGSQTSGGTLAPLFMIGGSMGYLFGSWIVALVPGLGVGPEVFAVAGMAAVFGTASRAPFTSIVFALEVTRDYQGVLPIIITVVIAELVGEALMEDSIMTERLSRRGLRIRNIYEYNPLRQIRIGSVMSAPVASVDVGQPVVEIYKQMTSHDHPFNLRKRLIVTSAGKAVGVIGRDQVFAGAASANSEMTAGEACSKKFESMRQEEFAYDALRRMTLRDASFIVVTG